MELVRRHRECHEKPAGQHDRHDRVPEDAIDDRTPDPALAVVAAQPMDERHASRSTLSPSLDSSAGSTVSDPSIATATTVIVATPKDAKPGSKVSNMPAMATRTVIPEISTERPDVAAAASSAASSLRPAARSSRSRFK